MSIVAGNTGTETAKLGMQNPATSSRDRGGHQGAVVAIMVNLFHFQHAASARVLTIIKGRTIRLSGLPPAGARSPHKSMHGRLHLGMIAPDLHFL